MTNLVVHSNCSDQVPVPGVKARLAQALDTAQELRNNAEWLQIEADELFFELKTIARGPVAPDIAAAVDAAAWTETAAGNIFDELSTLIDRLYDASAA